MNLAQSIITIIMLMAATMPLRMSEYSKFLLKNSFMVRDNASRNADWCVPP